MRYPPDYIKATHKEGWEVLIPIDSWQSWATKTGVPRNSLTATTYVERYKGYRFTRLYKDQHLQKLNEEAEHFYLELEDLEDMYGCLPPEPIEGELIPTDFWVKANFGNYEHTYWQDGKYVARVRGKYLGTFGTRYQAYRAVQEYLK